MAKPIKSRSLQLKAWRVAPYHDAELEIRRRERWGMRVCLIPARQCQTRAALFKTVAKALSFPAYFGRNWDAFNDCLRDATMLNRKGMVLVFVEAEHLLRLDPRDLRILLEIFTDTSHDKGYVSRRNSFEVLFVATPRLDEALEEVRPRKKKLYRMDARKEAKVNRELEEFADTILERIRSREK